MPSLARRIGNAFHRLEFHPEERAIYDVSIDGNGVDFRSNDMAHIKITVTAYVWNSNTNTFNYNRSLSRRASAAKRRERMAGHRPEFHPSLQTK